MCLEEQRVKYIQDNTGEMLILTGGEGDSLLNSKAHDETVVINTIYSWHNNKQIDQLHKMEITEKKRDSHEYYNLV